MCSSHQNSPILSCFKRDAYALLHMYSGLTGLFRNVWHRHTINRLNPSAQYYIWWYQETPSISNSHSFWLGSCPELFDTISYEESVYWVRTSSFMSWSDACVYTYRTPFRHSQVFDTVWGIIRSIFCHCCSFSQPLLISYQFKLR